MLVAVVLLLIGAIVGVVTERLFWVIVAVAVVLVVVLAGVEIARRMRSRSGSSCPKIGLVEVFDSPADARKELCRHIAAAKESVVLVGISHRSLLGDNALADAIKTCLKEPQVKVEVFFLATQSPALEERASDEGESRETFANDVSGNSSRLVGWADKNGRDGMEFFTYDEYPSWRIEKVDDTLFISNYPLGASGQASQVWVVKQAAETGSLYDGFSAVLDRLRRNATKVTAALPAE